MGVRGSNLTQIFTIDENIWTYHFDVSSIKLNKEMKNVGKKILLIDGNILWLIEHKL